MNYLVKMTWDDEATVWVATSDDVPGLVMEGGSLDALIERVRFAIPELLQLNNLTGTESIPVIFRSRENFNFIWIPPSSAQTA